MNGLIKKITPALCATLVSLTVIASDIPAQYPLFNVGRSAPNIMFTIDDSGSMSRDYMPESISGLYNIYACDSPNSLGVNVTKSLQSQYALTADQTTTLCKAANYNHIAYNPSVTYTPRVDYLNQSLGDGTGTCTDPVFTEAGSSTTTTVTTTTTSYSNCRVTQAYVAGSAQIGSCTTPKDTQLGYDTYVPEVPATGGTPYIPPSDCSNQITSWNDDKPVYTWVCNTPAVPATPGTGGVAAYWSIPSTFQGSPYYTPSKTKNTSQYAYCQKLTDPTEKGKYKKGGTNCSASKNCCSNSTTTCTSDYQAAVSKKNGIAQCTKSIVTETSIDGVAQPSSSVVTNDVQVATCSKSTCATSFSSVGQSYPTPSTTTDGPTPQETPIAATKTLNRSGVCEYLKYTPVGAGTVDDTNVANYTHVMLKTGDTYDSRQNGLSGRTDCADKVNFICTYEEEKQNYLNWRTYYSTRLDVSKTMIGAAFAGLDTRFRVGFAKINQSPAIELDVAEFTKEDELSPRATFFSELYNTQPPAWNSPTPLRRAMDDVGQYFSTATPWDGSTCRQTYNITMTDGNWTEQRATVATGNVDGSTGPQISRPGQTDYVYSAAAPYSDEHLNTLADVAMYYWNHDLSESLDNNVQGSVNDPAVWQHIIQYTIGFGVNGQASAAAKTAGQWPDPVAGGQENNPSDAKTDDLEHAAINGRGAFFNASNPAEFQNALANTLGAIDAASQTGSASAVAAVSNDYTTSTLMFQAGFEPGWVGRLKAFTLSATGDLTQSWSASIPAVPANRNIFTIGTDGSSVAFLWDNLSSTQQTALNRTDSYGSNVVDFIRGDKTTESAPYLFRHRTSLLGDIVNSNVLYAGKDDYGYAGIDGYSTFLSGKQSNQNMVYVGANDGMLHAFSGSTGIEAFAYIPSELVTRLRYLSDSDYASNHKYYVDGSPIAGDIKVDDDWKTLLVGTTGAGGKSIFGLDISDPENFAAGDVLWELSPANAASPDDLGYSIPKPSIAKTGSATWQVLVANGYGSVNGSAQLLRLNANTGVVANTIDMEATGSNGLSSPAVVDKNGDGIADLVYAGDLKGNIWRINLADNSKFKVFQACDGACATSNFQPITTKLEVRANPEGGLQILFGTGRYFSADDNTLSDPPRVEAIYGIRDYNNETTLTMSSLVAQNITAEYAVDAVATRAGTNTTVKTRVISNNSVDYNSKAGWYLPLKSPGLVNGVGERVVNDVSLVDDKLVVTTLIPESGVSGNACATGGTTWVMEIDPISGGRLQYSALNTNSESSVINKNDDLSDGNGGYVVASGVLQDGSTAPLILDKTSTTQKKVFTNLNGSVSALDEVSDSGAEGRQSWRQIR